MTRPIQGGIESDGRPKSQENDAFLWTRVRSRLVIPVLGTCNSAVIREDRMEISYRRLRRVTGVFVVAALLLQSHLAVAQTTGRIVGTVTDGQGAVLPGASVTQLPCHRYRLERLGWQRCTSARIVRHATSVNKGARTAASSACVSGPARHASRCN